MTLFLREVWMPGDISLCIIRPEQPHRHTKDSRRLLIFMALGRSLSLASFPRPKLIICATLFDLSGRGKSSMTGLLFKFSSQDVHAAHSIDRVRFKQMQEKTRTHFTADWLHYFIYILSY
jgi:hypothetical protein